MKRVVARGRQIAVAAAAKAAPGLASRVRYDGVPVTLARIATGRSQPLRASEAARIVRIARRLPTRQALGLSRLLRRLGELAAGTELVDALISRRPHSSPAHLEKLVLEVLRGRGASAINVVGVLDGDLRYVRPMQFARLAIECTDIAAVIRVKDAILAGELGGSERARRTAISLLDVALFYSRGVAPTELARQALSLQDAFDALTRWAVQDQRWDVLEALAQSLKTTSNRDLGASRGYFQSELARCVRVQGNIKAAKVLATEAMQSGSGTMARALVRALEEDVALLDQGWPRPIKRARTFEPRAGTMGYLLHNSLPHTSGGYATRTHGLLTGMADRGWHIEGVTRPGYPFDRPEGRRAGRSAVDAVDTIDGVEYHRIFAPAGGHLLRPRTASFARAVSEIAKRDRWGVVHAASNHLNGLAALEAAAMVGLPSVYEVRGLWEVTRLSRDLGFGATERFELIARLEADACRFADHVFAITGAVREILVERGVPREKISLLPNGVDSQRFVPIEPNDSLRASLGLEDKVVIGYVGSVVDYEGLELLIAAVAILVAKRLPVALLIVGDGDALAATRQKVTELGIDAHVVAPGRVLHHQVEAYYSIIDIAPFPRLPLPVTEAVSPLKPFEAMAMAKPVVVSSVNALLEIVTDGNNGRVFTKGDVSALAEVLEELVGDPQQRRDIGSRARNWVVENRDWKTIAGRIEDTYKALGVEIPQEI